MVRTFEEIRASSPSRPKERGYDDIIKENQQNRLYQEKVRNDTYSAIFADGRIESYLNRDRPDNFSEQLTTQESVGSVVRMIESHTEPNQYSEKLSNALDI